MKVMNIQTIVSALGTIRKGLVKRMEDRIQRSRSNHLDYSITKIGQNTEKNPEDLMRLAVTQTPVKNHQLMLV